MRWIFSLAFLLSACVNTPSATSLRIVSWNMEHLAEHDDSGCRPRTDADYAAMRSLADTFNADIVALQEVESAAAAARVFDLSRYDIVIEDRTGSTTRGECRDRPGYFLNRQATGFAIRHGIAFDRNPDFVALEAGNPDLRSGVDITIHPSTGAGVRLLSVHLKSGCASGLTNPACAELQRQVPILESWIDERYQAGETFVVLGDFNRRLAVSGDSIWSDWNDNDPPGQSLTLADAGVAPHCDPHFHDFIDHFMLGERAAQYVSGFHEWIYSGSHLSDHCPVSIDWRN